MKVVVAGGGIAGLTIAGLLSRTGAHEVVVLEHAREYGEAGYGIGLYPLGAAAFNALGASEELQRRSKPLTTYTMHGPDGAVLQSVDLTELLRDFGPMLGISRADLIEVLASRVPPGCIRFGVHAEAVERTGTGVVVRASDGSSHEGDVAVAADGMHSALRAAVFGKVEPYDTHFDAWMWWAPEGTGPAETASEYWGPSAFVGLYPMPGRVNVAVAVPRALSPDAKADPADILSVLREVVATHAPGAAAIDGLWAMQSSRPFLWPLLDMRAPDITALDGRLAFVGDSGIGFLPTAGVGASNALRSAAALAYDLSMADANSVPAALSRWRTRVKKLVEGNQHDSRQLARVMMVKHKTSSALINTLMKYMPVTAMTKSIVASMAAPF